MNEEVEDINSNSSSFESNVEKICKKASSKLQEYYQTYDSSLMDISMMSFEEYEFYPDYIRAIFNLMEGEGEIQENLLSYMKHVVPSFMFIILGIVSIVAWVFFCFYCCCNCCCCCCCKKPECKSTIMLVTLLFDLSIIISCLVGVLTSNKMFRGLADVECSLMKFISEINEGEKRQDSVKWIGFDEILKVFEEIKSKIDKIKTETENDLNDKYNNLTITKIKFPIIINRTYESMLDPNDPDSPLIFDTKYLVHVMQENTMDKLDVGVLDIVYNYGPTTNDEKFLYRLYEQYKEVTKKSNAYIEKAHDGFQNILENNSVSDLIDSSKKSIEEISSSINDIKDQIAGYIVDYSDLIDSYGKYIVKIIYIVIISVSAFSGLSVVLMYITAEECCYGKCCCGKGLTKTLSHISWNLMSLLMIFSFVICGIVFLLNYLGKDLVQVINVIVGQNNLYNEKPILIDSEVSNYFNICFHGDGDLAFLFGLTDSNSSTYQFDELNSIINDISESKGEIQQNDVVIKEFKETIENRKQFIDVNVYDFNTTTWFNLDSLIRTFNDLIKDVEYDVWTLNETCPDENFVFVHCPKENTTSKNVSEKKQECLNFKEWELYYEIRYRNVVYVVDMTYPTVLKAARYFVGVVNNISDYVNESGIITNISEKVEIVESAYNDVIGAEIRTLNVYNKTIHELTSTFSDINSDNGSLFSFLNCKFIGNNVLIILKNLQYSFAGNVLTIALTLVFASFGMLFSIIFTILEVIILNVSLYLQKRRREKEEQVTLALGAETRVLTFADTTRKKKYKNRNKKNSNSDKLET